MSSEYHENESNIEMVMDNFFMDIPWDVNGDLKHVF